MAEGSQNPWGNWMGPPNQSAPPPPPQTQAVPMQSQPSLLFELLTGPQAPFPPAIPGPSYDTQWQLGEFMPRSCAPNQPPAPQAQMPVGPWIPQTSPPPLPFQTTDTYRSQYVVGSFQSVPLVEGGGQVNLFEQSLQELSHMEMSIPSPAVPRPEGYEEALPLGQASVPFSSVPHTHTEPFPSESSSAPESPSYSPTTPPPDDPTPPLPDNPFPPIPDEPAPPAHVPPVRAEAPPPPREPPRSELSALSPDEMLSMEDLIYVLDVCKFTPASYFAEMNRHFPRPLSQQLLALRRMRQRASATRRRRERRRGDVERLSAQVNDLKRDKEDMARAISDLVQEKEAMARRLYWYRRLRGSSVEQPDAVFVAQATQTDPVAVVVTQGTQTDCAYCGSVRAMV